MRQVQFDANNEQPVFELGMVFKNVYEFREAVRRYSVKRGAKLRLKPNVFHRVRAKCRLCTWELFASIDTNTGDFVLKRYNPTHTCYKTNRNRHCNSNFIAKHFRREIIDNPHIKIWRLQEMVKEVLEVQVGKTVCRRARLKVVQELIGDYNHEFNKLYDYKNELLRSNPGSTCVVLVDTKGIPSVPYLRGFYVCFSAMKEGFKHGCKKFIGIDGCFLKEICKGELLSVTTKDANSQMYPIAWVVVDTESIHTWTWFLKLVQADLDLGEGEGCIVVSDMQKGLIEVVKDVLPNVEHRMCARHILANWAKTWRGADKRQCFWKICKSTFEAQLRDNMNEMYSLGGKKCVEELLNYNTTRWCRVYFPLGSHCDVIDNNISKTFNSWILPARHKTIITMLEEIRVQVMHRHIEMREFVGRWRTNISPMAMDTLSTNARATMRCRIDWNGDKGYEVVEGEYKHIVDLRKESCTCRAWELKGIPCPHAIAALHQQNEDPICYVSKWYGIEKYKLTYAHFIQPVLNMKMWPPSTHPAIQYELKPIPGRQKKNRRKPRDGVKKTGKLSKKGVVMKCSNCKQAGHNKKGCPFKGRTGEASSAYDGHLMRRKQRMPRMPPTTASTTQIEQQAFKMPRMTSVGIVISEKKTGFTYAQNLRGERTVISTGAKVLKNSVEVTGDIGFEPTKLKWKGKEPMHQSMYRAEKTYKRMKVAIGGQAACGSSQPQPNVVPLSIQPQPKSASQPTVVRCMP